MQSSSNCSLVPSAPVPKYVNYLVMVLLKFCIKQIHNHMELKGQSSVLSEPISTAALFTLPNSPFTLPNSPFTLHPLLYDTCVSSSSSDTFLYWYPAGQQPNAAGGGSIIPISAT